MFEKDYKEAMDKINPSKESLDKTLAAMSGAEAKKKLSGRMLARNIAVACVAVALVAVSVFGAFMVVREFDSGNTPEPLGHYGRAASLKAPGNYSDVYKAIESVTERRDINLYYGDGMRSPMWTWDGVNYDAVEEVKEIPTATDGAVNETDNTNDGTKSYSDTNNQVAGVQEADIVKTDGEYFYMLFGNTLNIAKADNGKLAKISSTELKDYSEEYRATNGNPYFEMFLNGDRLALLSRVHTERQNYTLCSVYDISNPVTPALISTKRQSGGYISSRCIDGVIYTVTSFYPNGEYTVDGHSARTDVIPEYGDDFVSADCIFLPDNGAKNREFTVISALDTGSRHLDSSAISLFGVYGILYSSGSNIYITNTRSLYEYYHNIFDYSGVEEGIFSKPAVNAQAKEELIEYVEKNKDKDGFISIEYTEIYRVSLDGLKLDAEASGNVPGYINDQFNMDEKNGYFRIATHSSNADAGQVINILGDTEYFYGFDTVLSQSNKVYVLNGDLEIVGASEPIGATELLKSSRFIGDIAYVVTFRQTDPLYAVDLSDPANPTVLSELKISGFSTYMQPYDKDHLLGIGHEADISTGGTTGLKLTMFDITDPKATFASDSLVYDYGDYWGSVESTALYNHKSVLIDSEKEIIAIPFHSYSIKHTYYGDATDDFVAHTVSSVYVTLFGFENGKLYEKGTVNVKTGEDEYNDYILLQNLRSNYIDDYAYITYGNGVISISLNDYTVIDTLEF